MPRRVFRLTILPVLVAACAVSAADAPVIPGPGPAASDPVAVERIVDGHTILVSWDGQATEARLAGVAPLLPEAGSARSARQFLADLLQGESVYVEAERGVPRRDGRGRLLARVYRAPDDLFVNLEVVRQGYGRADGSRSCAHAALLRSYERRAQAAGRGLWGKGADEALSVETLPGAYRLFVDGGEQGLLVLEADHTFQYAGGKIPQYRWEAASGGLVIMFYSGRWLFQPSGGGAFRGRYTGPDPRKLGRKGWLFPVEEASASAPASGAAFGAG